jgi:hypothetical protein
MNPIAWRGVPAFLVRGEQLACVLTVTGCHLAALTRSGETLNPLWQPQWPAVDVAAQTPDPALYGGPVEAPCLAGIVGSNLCLDRFGFAWPGEQRPLHGEAGIVRWQFTASADGAVATATLPLARLRVRRSVRFDGDTLHLATAVAHDDAAPRAVEWCEHTTLGGDFLDGAVITAGVDAVRTMGDLAEVAPDEALRLPAWTDAPCGSVRTARVAAGWWRAANARLGRTLDVRFDRDQFPWLCLWTQHRARTAAPWFGRERTRGMEMTTKPFPEAQPPAERLPRWLDRPTECLVPPGAWREHVISYRWG